MRVYAGLRCDGGCGTHVNVAIPSSGHTENDRRRARRCVLVVAEAQGWQTGPHGVDVDYCPACVAKGVAS